MKDENTQKPITDEIATVEKDIFRDYLGSVQSNPDKVLKSESGGKGIELYEDLLREDKVGSALQTRKLAVVGKEWEVIPASDKRSDQKIADFVKEVFLNFNYDAARKMLLSGTVLGFKPGEVMWERSEGDIWIKDIIGRASRRFVFDLQNKMRMLTLQNMVEGEELPDRKFIIFRNISDNGSPYGDGLGRMLYWPVWFKKNAIKFWLIFADKFGSPTPIGKYPQGTVKKQQDDLLAACEAIQQESAIAIPDNMIIEFLEATRGGSVNTYETLCNFMNSAIAQVLLGHTGTSQSTPGKLGSEDAAIDVKAEYVKSDADMICECQNNSLIKWLVDYNFPGVMKYPKVWIRTEDEQDLKPLAERDQILVNIGVPVTKKYFYDTYGIPEPGEGDELVTPLPKQPAFPVFSEKNKNHSTKCNCGKHHNFSEPDEWVDIYLDRISPMMTGLKETALKNIEIWLRGLSEPPSEGIFISKMQDLLGSAYENVDKTAINNTVTEMYTFYKMTDLLTPGLDVAFGGVDLRTVDFLSELDSFYLSKFIKNSGPAAKMNDFLREYYHEGGAGIFGRGEEWILELKNQMSQIMVDLTEGQIQTIVDTAVQRARNWGHISQLNDGGVAEIEIYEPTMDCDFCKSINGTVISVPQAYQMMQSQSKMSPGEYESFLKNKRNQPSLDNIESFVDRGMLPPYHPHCHGRLIKRIRE
jgi:phage gp29-like protein